MKQALILLSAVLFGGQIRNARAADPPKIGESRVCQWKNDAAAAFLLMFDDSWPSHWQVAIPELVKRGMIATFYICPGKGEHVKYAKEWEDALLKHGMVFGDHTMTHKGVKDDANAEWEIGECAKLIRQFTPNKREGLVSYGQPGVGPNDWNLTTGKLDALLEKHHLISRPTFVDHGAVYHIKTTEEMIALADKAIAARGMEYLVIHGVERITPDWGYQDMWPLKQDILLPFLDALKQRREQGQLWITDHISMHQYETERKSATVSVTESLPNQISLSLKSDADPAWYQLPLTLVTRVPASWSRVSVIQGKSQTSVTSEKGLARYDAVPGATPIVLRLGKD